MIKLHTKHKSNLNYYLFNVNSSEDCDKISSCFETEFGKQPIFSSFCTINAKSYAMIGTLDFYDTEDFELKPIKIFKSPKNDQNLNNPQPESFYICNFKEKNTVELFLLPLLNDLINWKVNESYIKIIPSDENPIMLFFRCSPDEIKYRIKILIPYFMQNELTGFFDNPIFTTKSSELPIIILKNINPSSEYQLNLQNFQKIIPIIEKNNDAKVINFCESKTWIYFSVKNNESAWEVINRLKYSRFNDDLIQFTHFLEIKDIEQAGQWNLLVLNIDKKENLQEIYERFSKTQENVNDKSSIKKILAIETYEESDSQNAKVQYLLKSDAYEILRKDPENIKMINFSMIVHHFDAGQEEKLRKIFKKASYIIEKQNNSPRTRPVYHIFFNSKQDLSEALLISGNVDKSSIAAEDDDETTNCKYIYKLSRGSNFGIYSNGLRAFCIAYRPQIEVNKIDSQLIKQTWKQNTVRIFDVDTNVQLSDAVEALIKYDNGCKIESLVFWKKDIIVSFSDTRNYRKALNDGVIEINGNSYPIENK